jgi:fused signal recognition particle receptor
VIDEELLEQLEESLIAADLGVETSLALVELLRSQVKLGESGDVDRVREILIAEVTAMLEAAPRPEIVEGPRVTLVVGINGAGKTTSIAKLARYSLDRGESVLLAAADTFRAAAIEQLQVWGQRLEVPVVAQKSGSDPAAVVFDALQAARARKIDHVIVDTAGRLHTKSNLMEELAKIGRVVAREAEDRRQQTLLVIDATNGQNAIQQAREFSQTVPVDSVFLTKLDGTAKGGVVVAVARDLKLPVLFLGVGEQADDLVVFEPASFARALFE